MAAPTPLAFLLAPLLFSPLLHAEGSAGTDPAPQDGQVRLMASEGCARCHSNSARAVAMRDADGAGIAPYDLWRASMMANSGRDPLWRAAVSAEVATFPSQREKIEATCMRCHAPMASLRADGRLGDAVATALLDGEGTWSDLGRDGVSCTVCHQIRADELGRPESFSGGLVLNDRAEVYGPHADPFRNPMNHMTGFFPTHGPHVLDSGLCGSCHTLFTEAFDADGEALGIRFPEQTPYLEWRNSAFSTEGASPGPHARSCQACHLPTGDDDGRRIETTIARNPGGRDFPRTRPRAPFGRHVLAGGNTLVPSILRDHAAELGVSAPREAFDAKIAAARDQLQRRTANVRIGTVQRSGAQLSVPVEVRNLTGHKLPTGHPFRRVWLRLRVTDAAGRVVFASGEHDDAGRLLDGRGRVAPCERPDGPLHPHRDRIESPDQVQVYETIAADSRGGPTFRLLSAAGHWKDDRLLPLGWRADGPEVADVRPHGVEGDADFGAGGDTVTYVVDAPAAGGPYEIEATLLYQALGARYAAELLAVDTPEVRAFERLYRAADRRPELVAADRRRTP